MNALQKVSPVSQGPKTFLWEFILSGRDASLPRKQGQLSLSNEALSKSVAKLELLSKKSDRAERRVSREEEEA